MMIMWLIIQALLAFDGNFDQKGEVVGGNLSVIYSLLGSSSTQYGWQWETRFADGYDVTGLVEWILLVGGIEKGLFLPSFSSLVGIRTSSNFEFAFGPNLSLSGVGAVVAIGKNFKVGELNLPVNIAFRPGIKRTKEFGGDTYYDSNTGELVTTQRTTEEYNSGSLISLVIGFNIGN